MSIRQRCASSTDLAYLEALTTHEAIIPHGRLEAKMTINQRQNNDLTIETITLPRFDFARANYANAHLVEEIQGLPSDRLSARPR